MDNKIIVFAAFFVIIAVIGFVVGASYCQNNLSAEKQYVAGYSRGGADVLSNIIIRSSECQQVPIKVNDTGVVLLNADCLVE